MIKDSIHWANGKSYNTNVDLETTTTDKCILDNYYRAYYYAKKNAYGNDIEIMESQVAFLQALLLPVIINAVHLADKNSDEFRLIMFASPALLPT